MAFRQLKLSSEFCKEFFPESFSRFLQVPKIVHTVPNAVVSCLLFCFSISSMDFCCNLPVDYPGHLHLADLVGFAQELVVPGGHQPLLLYFAAHPPQTGESGPQASHPGAGCPVAQVLS